MYVLGLTAFQRDAAAALVRDGELIAVAPEERFTRNRHEAAFPRAAVRACLARAGIEPHQLDALVLAEKPSRSFERLLFAELTRYPRSWRTFPTFLLSWLGDRLWARSRLAQEVGVSSDRVLFVDSQRARAAWAFFTSPCEQAAILVSDDAREGATTTLARGNGGQIEILAEVHDLHGLTGLGAHAARHLGFAGVEDLGRFERLADHGSPSRRTELAHVLAIHADGSHAVSIDRLADALGPPRAAGAAIDGAGGAANDAGVHADAAASVMLALGDALLSAARELHRRTGLEDLCFGGELAEMSSLNARLLAEGPFRRLWVPPAPGEVGAAAGAALHAAHVLGAPRARPLDHAFLAEDVILDHDRTSAPVDAEERIRRAVDTLCAGGLVGWMHGRAEIGRQALGHRSLLANPRSADWRERIAQTVGRYEGGLGLPCAVPEERAAELFEIPEGGRGPARFRALRVRPREHAREWLGAALQPTKCEGPFKGPEHEATWIEPQLVDARVDPAFHALLSRFGQRTGLPVLVTLPLCRSTEPTVRREADARELQRRSDLDLLCVDDRVHAGPTLSSPSSKPADSAHAHAIHSR